MLKRMVKKILQVSGLRPDNYPFDSFGNFYSKKDMVFLGSKYGGWFIPANFSIHKEDACYFVGAGEDVTFDCSVAAFFPCNVDIFDPTPKAVAHFKKLESQVGSGGSVSAWKNMREFNAVSSSVFERISFHPFGVAGADGKNKFFLPANPDHVSCSIVNLQKTEDYFIAECFTLKTIMNKLGHVDIKLLKIDIEGAEYQVIDSIIKNNTFPSLLAIEFDELHTEMDSNAVNRVGDYVKKIIDSGYSYIFRDGCNLVFLREI